MPLDVAKIMGSARLKVKRANSHIDCLVRDSSPLSRELYEIRVDRARSKAILAEPDLFDLRYVPKQPIPDFFALIIGDAIHNLRTGLDHWAASLVSEATGKERDRSVFFPLPEKRQYLESASGYVAIEKALPDAAHYIRDAIKPYGDSDGNRDLWAITDLDNIDKHNFILPTITVVTIDNINARTGGGGVVQNSMAGGDAAKPMIIVRSDAPITIQNNFKTTVEITFGKGNLFEDQPVIPTLAKLSKVVSKTLDSLERFLNLSLNS